MKEKLYDLVTCYFKQYSVDYNGILDYLREDCDGEYCSHSLTMELRNTMFFQLYLTGECMTDKQFLNFVLSELTKRRIHEHEAFKTKLLDPIYLTKSK